MTEPDDLSMNTSDWSCKVRLKFQTIWKTSRLAASMGLNPSRWQNCRGHRGRRKPHFWVCIPHNALGGVPHGLVMYGHGLLNAGTRSMPDTAARIANDHKLIFFATNLLGIVKTMRFRFCRSCRSCRVSDH